MDEMKIGSKFTTSIISKLASLAIRKKFGYDVKLNLNEVNATIVDGKTHVHLDIDADLEKVDPETGKEKKVKKTVMVADPNLQSDYAVYFDSKSRNYETNPDYNRMFLKAQQAFANDKLQTRGHLFLNEVLDDLDLPRTPAGQIVGWTKDGPDGYVNFRIVEVEREIEDGRHEPALLLDFNVEGNIWEKM